MPLLHLYSTGFKCRRAFSFVFLVNFLLGTASEVKGICHTQHSPLRDRSHLMGYSMAVHNHHTKIPVKEWTNETTVEIVV